MQIGNPEVFVQNGSLKFRCGRSGSKLGLLTFLLGSAWVRMSIGQVLLVNHSGLQRFSSNFFTLIFHVKCSTSKRAHVILGWP